MTTLPETATTQEIADILGVTPRHLQQLVSEGHIDGKLERGRFNLRRAIATYLAYCRRERA